MHSSPEGVPFASVARVGRGGMQILSLSRPAALEVYEQGVVPNDTPPPSKIGVHAAVQSATLGTLVGGWHGCSKMCGGIV